MNDRYLICKKCDKFDDTLKKCRVCGCFMPVKTKIKTSKCPEGKWDKLS